MKRPPKWHEWHGQTADFTIGRVSGNIQKAYRSEGYGATIRFNLFSSAGSGEVILWRAPADYLTMKDAMDDVERRIRLIVEGLEATRAKPAEEVKP